MSTGISLCCTRVLLCALCSGFLWPAAASENLLSQHSGATIVHRTTETPDAPVAGLIDTQGTTTPWISEAGDLDQTVTFQLRGNVPFNTVHINPASAAPPHTWAKVIAIDTADPYPHMGGWRRVAVVHLKAEDRLQTFSFPRIRGRYVRITVQETQGPKESPKSVGDIRLFFLNTLPQRAEATGNGGS